MKEAFLFVKYAYLKKKKKVRKEKKKKKSLDLKGTQPKQKISNYNEIFVVF